MQAAKAISSRALFYGRGADRSDTRGGDQRCCEGRRAASPRRNIDPCRTACTARHGYARPCRLYLRITVEMSGVIAQSRALSANQHGISSISAESERKAVVARLLIHRATTHNDARCSIERRCAPIAAGSEWSIRVRRRLAPEPRTYSIEWRPRNPELLDTAPLPF